MQVRNLIQSMAQVLTITSLNKGDMVKMIEESGYSNPEVRFAIVTDIMNSGEKTFVEMLVYRKSYNSVDAEVKLYSGEKELHLFPTTVEEAQDFMEDTVKYLEKDLKEQRQNVQKKEEAVAKLKDFISGELTKKIQPATFAPVQNIPQLQEVKL